LSFLLTFAIPKLDKKMPKMKTHSRAKKTFKITGSGGVKYRKAGRGHLLTKKGTKRKRHLRISGGVDSANMSMVKRLLCNGTAF
jgi:large subunit ribosomal protein L35